MSNSHPNSVKGNNSSLGTVIAYAIFCGLGFSCRIFPALFLIFAIYGIGFPLLWAMRSRNWSAIGFTKHNIRKALLWGVVAGTGWSVYTYLIFNGDEPLPPLWGLQIAIAFPVWLIFLSPFQELFFRGWFQPRIQTITGKWAGLLLTSLAFTVWHFFPPFEGTPTTSLPLSSITGIISTFMAGMLFGYLYQRTQNIIAPWLAHAIGGIALVLIGLMSFIQYVE
jgi:membrane protease YdiL (CAAX protease family)